MNTGSGIARFLAGSSLRQRFMIAPLLGLIVCSLLTAAFFYQLQRQNGLLLRITEQDLTAFNRYAELFVDLTREHTALYDLLNGAGKLGEATVRDLGNEHLRKVQQAAEGLEQALPPATRTEAVDFGAPRNQLSASTRAYRSAATTAVERATASVAFASGDLAFVNEQFTAMNRAFAAFLELRRGQMSAEVTARVRASRIGSIVIAVVGVGITALLFFLSRALSQMLCGAIEAQIGMLTDLGAQAGARARDGGNDEVERMALAIDAFKQALLANTSLTMHLAEMRRLDQMKSDFVSVVSHELRTPLTSIRGSLGLIAGGVVGRLPEGAKKLLDIAQNNCERLIRLINDILDTEKMESGTIHLNLVEIDLQPLVKQTLAANEGFAVQHQVSLALRGAKGSMRVRVDSDRLVQALTNLVANAVKFSPAQGTVEVVVSRAAGRVRVEVRDSGAGIPEIFRSRIFQKFSQADSSDTRQKGGTGLGLNISKAIIERLGGTIGFASKRGVGTTFFFELPECRDSDISTPVLPKTPMAADARGLQPVV
jgi:signal transduction histidine kinase